MKKNTILVTFMLIPAFAFASDNPISLGKLVSTFLVPMEAQAEWSMGATSLTPEIHWQSVGVETETCGTFSSCRRGTSRVLVAEKELQNLRQRLEPVQWDIFMTSSELPKFGPEQVIISPSCDTVSCEFNFEEGMASSGISVQYLCHAGPDPFRQTAYLLDEVEKQAIAVIDQNSGSGGESTSLTLIYSSTPDDQGWCAEARAME